MTKPIKVCVDMTLPPWMRREARRLAIAENKLNAPGKLAMPVGKKWASGRVLRVRFLDGASTVQARVREKALDWMQYANIEFAFGNDPDAEIRISFRADSGSWSFLGTDNLSIPKYQPTMNFGWLNSNSTDTEVTRVVKHEFGHALGLIHEHQHPTANIPWDKPKVYAYYQQTQGWTKEEIDVQLFQRYDTSTTNFSEYDKTSIMHYPVDNSLTIGDFEVGWNTDLSAIDKAWIGTVYPKQTSETPLTVNGAAVSANIGSHGEQDLYRFTVTTRAVYTIETKGKTDVVAALFDENDNFVAEDDDSGYSTNARIVSTLAPGDYTVVVRHYRPTGTGTYSISVKAA